MVLKKDNQEVLRDRIADTWKFKIRSGEFYPDPFLLFIKYLKESILMMVKRWWSKKRIF